MSPEQVRIAETRAWLRKAANDLAAANVLHQGDPSLQGSTAFHCQQAVEKALKGFLVWHSTPFRKTHSLEELGAAALLLDASLDPLVGQFVPLTEYAWCFRYPGEDTDPDEIEAGEALAIATEVMDAILGRLPEAVHP